MSTPRDRLREAPASLRLYAVTDDAWLDGRSLESCCVEAVRGGATFLQLRDKRASTDGLVAQYRRIRAALDEAGFGEVLCVIDDDVEAALAADADGVHVGQDDTDCVRARAVLGPDKIVGVSAQSVEQACAAEVAGADYVGAGALIATPTKPDAAHVSRDELRRICAATSIPVVGIGGLNARTVSCLEETGAAGAAVVSAIFAADDIEKATRMLRREVDRVV